VENEQMPDKKTPYHINPQRADALIKPMAVTVGEMADRATHYLERLRFAGEDRAAIEAAQVALATAHAELDRLLQARRATPRT
jgi:hypothetical protein